MAAKEDDGGPRGPGDAGLAREIASTLAALATPAPVRGGAPTPAAPVDARPGFDLDHPRSLLDRAVRYLKPQLPEDAGWKPLKRAVLRFLRIVTRDQGEYNAAVLDSVRAAYAEVEGGVRGSRDLARQAAEEARAADRHAAARAEEVEAALGREAEARALLEAEVTGSQHRLDRLERESDRRAEEARLSAARAAAAQERLERHLDSLASELRLARLEWTTLRRELSALPARSGESAAPAASHAGVGVPRADDPLRAGVYADFERTFRGSEEAIRQRQEADVPLFRGLPGPVADLGCGRGELLEALAAAGIQAVGCDANPVMAARGKQKGLSVDHADLFEWLSARPDGSLGGIAAYQVVEHLPPVALFDLVELAAAKLAVGGRLFLETVNPESVFAMRWFWMDLSHVRPVPGPALAQLLSSSGFGDVAVGYRSPVPPELAPPPEVMADPRLAPLAGLLFGPQDVTVTGVK